LGYQEQVKQDREILKEGLLPPDRFRHVPQLGTAATGTAGTGKTLAFEYALGSYPPVLEHRYKLGVRTITFKQVIAVKLNLFQDASLKALGIEFFERLGEIVGEDLRQDWGIDRCNRNNIQPLIYLACREYHVGMIVVDELQYMAALGEGYRAVLRYFTRMMNCLGVAVALIGTTTARTLMNQDLAVSRRFLGSVPQFHPFARGRMWTAFLNEVWRYQYVQQTEPLDELEPVMHTLTGGVPDLVVKLYLLAQMRLFGREREVLTRDVLNETAHHLFYAVKDRILELKGQAPEGRGITNLVQTSEKAFKEMAIQETTRNGAPLPMAETTIAPIEIAPDTGVQAADDMMAAASAKNVKAALKKMGALES
jgi:hypothetical protein